MKINERVYNIIHDIKRRNIRIKNYEIGYIAKNAYGFSLSDSSVGNILNSSSYDDFCKEREKRNKRAKKSLERSKKRCEGGGKTKDNSIHKVNDNCNNPIWAESMTDRVAIISNFQLEKIISNQEKIIEILQKFM